MRTFRIFLQQKLVIRALALGVTLVGVNACGIFDKAKASVEAAAELPLDATESTKITLDVSAVLGAAAGQTTPTELKQDVTTPPAVVDLNKSQPDLAKYANGHIKTVTITKITVQPTTNTLTGDLPALDIYIGPTDAKSTADGIKVATIPAIKAGSTTAFDAQIDTAAMASAGSKYLAKLAFSQALKGTLQVAAGGKVPSGKVDLKIDLGVHAVVSPL